MTVNELISNALIDIGVLGQGQTAAGTTANFALGKLNRLIDGWKNNRLLTFTITRATFTISGAASYTVGTGATISIARPPTMNMQGCNVAFIDTASSTTTEISLWPLTDDTYQDILNKSQTATYPTSWYYNPTYTSAAAPYGTLILWPLATSATLTGVFYAPVAAATVALADTLALPPGYERFYETNLGAELCTSYPVSDTVYQRITKQASDSMAVVEKVNTRLQDLTVDLALIPQSQSANIYTGP